MHFTPWFMPELHLSSEPAVQAQFSSLEISMCEGHLHTFFMIIDQILKGPTYRKFVPLK